jgi:hypothetical protein
MDNLALIRFHDDLRLALPAPCTPEGATFVRPEQPERRAPDRLASAAFSARRGVLGAGFRLWLFGLAGPSPLRRTVRVDFARRDLSGKCNGGDTFTETTLQLP